jgi:hypothetical protein
MRIIVLCSLLTLGLISCGDETVVDPVDTASSVDTWSLVDTAAPADSASAVDTVSSVDTASLEDAPSVEDTGTEPLLDTGSDAGSDTGNSEADAADTSAPVDTIEPADVAEPMDVGMFSDTVEPVDSAMPTDGMDPGDVDLNGSWVLVAEPSELDTCGIMKPYDGGTLVLSVNGNQVTGSLAPPGLFITLEFGGNVTGTQLTMEATWTEAGPPAVGFATEHTHTIDAHVTSETTFQGIHVHELDPNSGDTCTYNWTITGTKQ